MAQDSQILLVAALLAALSAACSPSTEPSQEENMLEGVVFYASFDEAVRGDHGTGAMTPRTRTNHETERGQYLHQDGFDSSVFQIAPGEGVHGAALKVVDVLPRNGRIYFPAKGNLPYRSDGWSGTISLWLKIDPNTMLKSRFCDPIQITQKGATNGGLWIDFPDTTPRDLRLGAFQSEGDGRQIIGEDDPDAPVVRVTDVAWRDSDWHHVAFVWENFDSGLEDASATLYIDGRTIGSISPRNITMAWDLEQTGIYVAVNYIGLLDELAIFDRVLSPEEVARLHSNPGLLARSSPAGE